MDLEAKAPLYSLFEETLRGLATIRAFGWQSHPSSKNDALLDRSQKPFYLLFAVQRWLILVLHVGVAGVAVLLIVLIVELRGTVAAGGVGLALLNIIQFSQNVKLLVTFWTTLETQIGAVSRIRTFTQTTHPKTSPSRTGLLSVLTGPRRAQSSSRKPPPRIGSSPLPPISSAPPTN